MSEYLKQANLFASKHGIKLSFIGDPEWKRHFPGDKQNRYVFKCKLTRNGKSYTFNFGQSIVGRNEEPSIYDILACLTKSDPGTYENFCSEFGISMYSERTYKAVCREWEAVERLFGDIIEELQEIN